MSKEQKKVIVLFFIIMVTVSKTFSQTIADSTIQKIDSIFKIWDNAISPGCTIGIVMNDSLVYTKGYGLANLEYGIPNTPQTLFHMASVSKQFTAYSIILLAQQGKLSLEDDIHTYLPWFPDLKEKITIRNLLNHTSGIRDQWQLLAISGTRLDDVITQEHIVKILSKQQALNFKPGAAYEYSNSGFTMLAEIVKSVSGLSLRKFTDSAIFKPLGMNSTHFHDDYTAIEKNRSYSYERLDSSHFSNSILSYSNAGATSLFTNIPDMSKWIMNFYDSKVGTQNNIDQLMRKAKLNDGKELTYAQGIVSDTYKGWKQFSHGGSDAGYRTYVSIFPDLKMGFIVLSNLADLGPTSKTYAMADLFIKDTTQKKEEIKKAPRDSMAAVLKDTSVYKKFTGNFIGDDGLAFSFDLKSSRLYYHIFDETNFLIKELKDTFSIPEAAEVKFVFGIKSKDTTVTVITPDKTYYLSKYIKDTAQNDNLLKTYTGIYHCPELDCKYGIIIKDHQLMLTNVKYNDTKLTMVSHDHLSTDFWWMDHLKILRDTKKQIIGFEVNSGRVMHLKFNKIK
ncbi:hypothetical protein BH11BAC3_BH11BAC3_33240 [soil metagenome]